MSMETLNNTFLIDIWTIFYFTHTMDINLKVISQIYKYGKKLVRNNQKIERLTKIHRFKAFEIIII